MTKHMQRIPVLMQEGIHEWVPFVSYKLFTTSECGAIRKLGAEAELETANVNGFAEGDQLFKVRNSTVGWLDQNDERYDWIMDRISSRAYYAAGELGIDVVGFEESMQFTRYGVGQYYGEHTDGPSTETIRRKLSIVVQLCPSNTYKGGDLVIDGIKASRACGVGIFFPSYQLHEATRVESGVRESLVVWLGGPPFR